MQIKRGGTNCDDCVCVCVCVFKCKDRRGDAEKYQSKETKVNKPAHRTSELICNRWNAIQFISVV